MDVAELVGCLAVVAAELPDSSDKVGGILLGALGAGVILILLGVLFLVRKALMVLFNVLLISVGVVLVIVAVFGKPLGIYDRIFDLVDDPPATSEEQAEQEGGGSG